MNMKAVLAVFLDLYIPELKTSSIPYSLVNRFGLDWERSIQSGEGQRAPDNVCREPSRRVRAHAPTRGARG